MVTRPQTIQEAKKLAGSAVLKWFAVKGDFKPFKGQVTDARNRFRDPDTNKIICCQAGAFLYDVLYEDDDEETLEWEALVEILDISGFPVQQGGASGSSGSMADFENQAPNPVPAPHAPAAGKASSQVKRRASKVLDASINEDPPAAAAGCSSKKPSQNKRSRSTGSKSQVPSYGVLGEQNTNVQGASADPLAEPQDLPMEVDAPAQGQDMEEDVPQATFRTKGLPGHIKRVVLQNFMCHENLEVPIGPHVTLISGDNGSGKSAVLQALQTCLGVSARNTGRGDKLAGFIKNGVDTATIMVTLWNNPSDKDKGAAFRHEQYGDFIVIERTLRRNGAGAYRVFGVGGRSGHGSSTRKEDVDFVLEHFSINAGNPLTIITQDMARAFHAGSAADKRYKFDRYMSGTALDESQRSIASAQGHMAKAMAGIEEGEAVCKAEEVELERLNKELAKLKGMERKKEMMKHLENRSAWSMLYNAEEQVQLLTEKVAALGDEIPDLEQALQQQQDELANIKEQVKCKTTTLEQAMHESSQAASVLAQRRAVAARAATRLKAADKNKTGILKQIDELHAQKEDIETQLHDAETQLTQVDSRQVLEAKRKLADAYAKLKACNEEMVQLNNEFNDLRTQQTDVQTRLNDMANKRTNEAHRVAHHLQPKVVALQQQLHGLEGDQVDRATWFGGNHIPRLQQMISQHRFQHQPIGPVGAYLNLTDKRWGRAAEGCMGGLMNRFICFSQQDLKTVNEMARKIGLGNVNAFVVTPNVPRHNIGARPPEGYSVLLDVVRIDHPVQAACDAIFNVLIDKSGIERTILQADDESAKAVAYSKDPGLHGYGAVAENGWQYRVVGQGTVNQVPYKRNDAPRLGTDVSAMRQQCQAGLQQAMQDVLDAEAQVAELDQVMGLMRQQLNDLNTRSGKVHIKKRHIKADIQKQEAKREQLNQEILAQDAGEGQHRIMLATQNMQDCDLNIQTVEGDLAAAEQELEQAHAAKTAADEDYSAQKARAAREQNFAAINAEIEKLAAMEGAAMQRIKASEVGLAEARRALAEEQDNLEDRVASVPRHRDNALEICPEEEAQQAVEPLRQYFREKFAQTAARGRGRRANPTQAVDAALGSEEQQLEARVEEVLKTAKALIDEFDSLNEAVQEAEKSAGGSVDEVEFEKERQDKKVSKLRTRQDLLANNIRQLRHSLNQRIRKHDQMKTITRDQCNRIFSKGMKKRGSLGEMMVNYAEGTLSVRVKIGGVSAPKTKWVEDLKQLSGGERSFTTVCLLLALAEYCEFPFHCLDEYDVFMDAVVRRHTTGTLLAFGADKTDRQLILLTPQDLGVLPDALAHVESLRNKEGKPPLPEKFIHTIKMKPPRKPTDE